MTHAEYEALWLNALREEAEDTVNMLSNPRKPERERRTAAAFLRCAGVAFEPNEVISSRTEPPDVLFRSARFEIALVQEERRMHEEWRDTARRRAQALSIVELIEPYHAPESLTRQRVADLIIPTAERKAQRYCARRVPCADLDLLLYVNRNASLIVDSPRTTSDALVHHGWRSVSVLLPPHSYVVLADSSAPDFIVESVEKPTAAWTCPGLAGLFDI